VTEDRLDVQAALERGRRSERLLELFLEHAPDIVTVLEPDLTQRLVAGAVEQVLGYPRSEVATRGMEFVHPDDAPGLVERAAALRGGGWVPTHRYRVRHADGSWRWIETTTSDLRDTELGGFLTFSRDVTEHEEQSRANAEARARIEALVSGFHDPVLLAGADGVVIIANLAALELYGMEATEVIGRSDLELWEHVRPLFRPTEGFEQRARQSLESGTPMRGEELQLADGRVLEVDHIPVVVDHELLGRVWAMRDVTAQRDEAHRRERHLEVERELRLRAQQQLAELGRVDEMRRRLVSTVSHELRTPLTSIISHLQLLVDDDLARFQPDDASALAAAERNAKRLQRLVDDLLDVQRMETRGTELRFADVDLEALVREQVASMAPVAAEHDVLLGAETQPTRCRLDEGRMRQVVDNLVSNAIRFTPAGGRVCVRVGFDENGPSVRVSDTGVGIAPEHVPHVFEPFFRVVGDDSTVSGTGLGLSIVRAIVEAHGGAIACESVPGEGSTFTVRLPAAETGGEP
jgi:PAS domain S-box-containing protein